MKKKLISILLVLAMTICAFPMSAFAASPDEPPSWVNEGEEWFPANGIMPLEDYGNCPKGHTGPEGYTYQGYSTGKCTMGWDSLGRILTVISILSGDAITIKGAALGAALCAYLDSIENPNEIYFHYVYTKDGAADFHHIIYTIREDNIYKYITCETYYEL